MKNNWKPTDGKNRIEHIDIMRGFAILGIFIVNIGAFSAPYFLYGGNPESWETLLEQFTLAMVDILFQGSFYTMFSILFGFSWQLMIDRMQQRGTAVTSFLLRRQLILIVFGLMHAFLLWHGDILLSYGLIGLLLFSFIEVKDRTLLLWAGVLLVGSSLLFTRMLYDVRFILDYTDEAAIGKAIDHYSSGNIFVIWGQNVHDWNMTNSGVGLLLLIPIILPMFLLGMYLARKRIFHEPEKHQYLLGKLLIITFIFSVLFKFGPYVFGNPTWLGYIQDNIGGTASALFYMTLIVFIQRTRIGDKILQPLKNVGRIALSNYILQSVVCFILFYGVGFGLYDSVVPSVTVGIVITVYFIQIFLSKWWLSKFRFGPLEWVWRSLNYKKRQPFKR